MYIYIYIYTKGRVACEVSTSDELLITKLVFAGTFQVITEALFF